MLAYCLENSDTSYGVTELDSPALLHIEVVPPDRVKAKATPVTVIGMETSP